MMVLRGLGGVFGGSREFWGGSGGVQRGLIFSHKAHFAPLEVLYGTRFRSKYYIMVQLANFNWVSIPDPFLAHWGPIRGSQTVIL